MFRAHQENNIAAPRGGLTAPGPLEFADHPEPPASPALGRKERGRSGYCEAVTPDATTFPPP